LTVFYENKKIMITGASSGLGKEIVKQFAKINCEIFLTARNLDALKKLHDELKNANLPSSVTYKSADLTDTKEIESLIENVRNTLGHVDVLINSAGVFPVSEISNVTLAEFRHCFDLNVLAPFILTQEFCSEMKQNRLGRIINIGSSSAYGGASKTSVYCASKHAILGLTRSLHKELKEHNIRVFCISPGSIQTPMGRKVEALGQKYETFIDPKEIAKYIIQTTSYNTQMISEEIRLNRMEVQ